MDQYLVGKPDLNGLKWTNYAEVLVFYVAKLVQALGVVYVSYAMWVGFTQENSMGPEMQWMMTGATIFLAGRLIEWKASA